MDDFVLFHSDKVVLKNWRKDIKEYLEEELGLKFKEKACFMDRSAHGLSFLGRRVFRAHIRMKPENMRRLTGRLRKRLHAWQTGECDQETFMATLNSYWAYLSYFPSYRLRNRLLLEMAL